MNRLFLLLCVACIFLLSCQKEENRKGDRLTLEVELIEQACNANLKIVETGVEVTDFQGLNTSTFLYSDIERHNDEQFMVGDVFTIEFIVLEDKPYPVELFECTVPDGIQVKILAIE